MRALAFTLAMALAATGAARAARPSCADAVATALPTCIVRARAALGVCAACTDGARHATEALRRQVLARCTAKTLPDAGYLPPFDPAALATRLEDACLAHAAALAGRGADAFGAASAAGCLRTLAAVSTGVMVRELRRDRRCTLTGRGCKDEDKESAAVSKAKRRCRALGLSKAAVFQFLLRVRAQASCALADTLPGLAPCAPSGPDALIDLWHLASPRPPGTLVAQVSSYDRTGGNADLGVGPDTEPLLARLGIAPAETDFSYLYQDGDRYVIFDEQGPGVVWRIWMTGLDGLFDGQLGGDLAFELDGEAMPRLTLTRARLFAGTTPPFVAPLAGDLHASSGGFYSVVPIAFARRLRITSSVVPNWLQITFSRLPPDQPVASFDPARDPSAVAARLASAGDPALTVTPTATDTVGVAVAAGATSTVWSRTGPGTIVRLELLAPAGADIPTGLRLLATFDAAATPQVDVPLDDFFGAALGAGAKSVAFGRDGDRYYCYFPMPFAAAARLDLRNDGGIPFTGWTLHVGSVDARPPGSSMHFHAAAAAAHVDPDGRDYVLLDTTGDGHVVGVVLTAGCAGAGLCQLPNLPGLDGSHLEGDERVSLDGSRWPALHGTGLEDFFNGGFYFLFGAFRLPTHGNPVQVPATSPRRPGLNLRSAYRLFLGDAIPFRNTIRFAIEHGPVDDVPAELSSAVFFYARPEPALVESDRVTLGDLASEGAHALTAEGREDRTLTSAFRGDDSDVPVTASGMTARVTRFRVAVEPRNRGVRLRRLADFGGGRQTARVLVDGDFAGVWRTSEVNPGLRWAEPEFELPAALTATKGRIVIELDATDSPTPWTAFGYVVASHVP